MQPRPLADSDAACGGKAAALARLIDAELPVPDGFVLDASTFADAAGELDTHGTADELGHVLAAAAARIEAYEPPAELAAEVLARTAALGTVAVRSSATIEDGEAGAAAGVFSSRIAVPAAEVWAAIRAVWASALTPLAASYARRRGAAVAIGVIVQRFVEGDRVTVYTRPPGQPRADEAWIQHGERVIKLRREAGDPVVDLAVRAERAIDAVDGADVELVRAEDRTWVVQARPIVHPAPRVRTPPPPAVLAPLLADGRRWTWDVAHNPDPLSPAQAGLVEHVDGMDTPWAMRVCAGFLYTAPRAIAPLPEIASAAELASRIAEHERWFAVALDASRPPDSVERAVERYAAFYLRWARGVVPLIAAARATLRTDQLAGARPSAVDATLLAAARGELDEAQVLARIGVMAPAWDVAVPTFAERPALIRNAIAQAALVVRGTAPAAPAAPTATDEAAQIARLGADLAELDDVWFARAQWLVRRALLARGAALGITDDDASWLPLDLPAELDPDDARRRASAARAAGARAGRWEMPLVVGGPATDAGSPLHGVGFGPRISGRVVRFDSLASAASTLVRPGDVVVARAVTPALAVIVVGCAALISETGGPLDHGAALARELGIPCVVGCRDAWARLTTGMLVTVDGDRGIVTVDES